MIETMRKIIHCISTWILLIALLVIYFPTFSTQLRALLTTPATDNLIQQNEVSLYASSSSSSLSTAPHYSQSIAQPNAPVAILNANYSRNVNWLNRNRFGSQLAKVTSSPIYSALTVAPRRRDAPVDRDGSTQFYDTDGKPHVSICDQPNGFLQRQKKLCRQYLHLMTSVIRGYYMGLQECEYQFAAHRWNCQGHNHTVRASRRKRRRLRERHSRFSQNSNASKSKPIRLKTYMDKLLSRGTRESAYVLAVTSAGVSHAVTKACSSGLHDNCGCDRTIYDHPREPNFEWSGCSDNIHFGAAFSRQFLDIREKGRVRRKPKLGLTNLHNNHVGRQTVINKMNVQCKCHGVSGSCEMRTCWRSLPKFRDVGTHLQQRFHAAVQVEYVKNRLLPITALRPLPKRSASNDRLLRAGKSELSSIAVPTENDLLYIIQSPTFCHHDPHYGSLGTYGRRCVEGSNGPDSCDELCCGRGFRQQTYVQEERCNCKFLWCCKVQCDVCRKNVVVSTCN